MEVTKSAKHNNSKPSGSGCLPQKEDKEMKYRVKREYADRWYGDADTSYIEECQKNGVPEEDIRHMVREYGESVLDELEEI